MVSQNGVSGLHLTPCRIMLAQVEEQESAVNEIRSRVADLSAALARSKQDEKRVQTEQGAKLKSAAKAESEVRAFKVAAS